MSQSIKTPNTPRTQVNSEKYLCSPHIEQKSKTMSGGENQDGGIGRHTVPPRTTRTDRKSNKEVRHQVDKKETYIQTGGRGGDRHGGREDSSGRGRTETGGVWDEWGRQSDRWRPHAAPHSPTDGLG